MWRNLERQVRFRIRRPAREPIRSVDGAVARDRFGNALGGIRLPELDLPVATYSPNNEVIESLPGLLQPSGPLLNLFCVLSGSVFPFDEATLDALYPTPGGTWMRTRSSWLCSCTALPALRGREDLRNAAIAGAP